MLIRTAYLALAGLGAIVPWIFFYRFFTIAGPQADFVAALFANGAAGGFSADLLISSLVFWIAVFTESRRFEMRHAWVYVPVTLAIGLSCALPLFLYFREEALEKTMA